MKRFPTDSLVRTAATFFILTLAAVDPTAANATLPPAKSPHSVANGQRIFSQSCASCHNANSTLPKVGVGLKGYYQHQPRPTDSAVRAILLKGKGNMPAFSALNSSQIDDLIAYLRTL